MVHSFSEALGESGSFFVGVPVRILHVGSISESSFEISGAQNRDDCFLLEVVLSSPFKEQGSVLWQASFFAILRHIWLACSINIFSDVQKFREDIWELVTFNAFV